MSLVLKDIVSGYLSEVDILHNISLHAEQGKITGIIGPNGAGKSTIIKTICGFIKPRKGQIYYKDQDITSTKPHILAGTFGITYIAQERNVFLELTVKENLKVCTWPLRKDPDSIKESLKKVYEKFPVLKDKLNDRASSLSGGQQRMLELSRAFIQKSELILIDEPTAGLAPKVAMEVYEAMNKFKEEKLTVLFVDQNVRQAVRLSDYLYMLRSGQIFKQGPKKQFESELESLIHEWI
jgi:branched-chain amino acid transport system ATP-binding protein